MVQLFGITGGIGSGKTTVAKGLQEMGYAVYFTDTEAKRLLNTNSTLVDQVKDLLGEAAYQEGSYNTKFVASRVFNEPVLLQKLNALVHPVVFNDLQQWVVQQSQWCFVESAILFESGLNAYCDAVVAVTAPEHIRVERTMQRDNVSAAQVYERMQTQLSDNELYKCANLIVNNDGQQSILSLCLQIQEFCRTFAGQL